MDSNKTKQIVDQLKADAGVYDPPENMVKACSAIGEMLEHSDLNCIEKLFTALAACQMLYLEVKSLDLQPHDMIKVDNAVKRSCRLIYDQSDF